LSVVGEKKSCQSLVARISANSNNDILRAKRSMGPDMDPMLCQNDGRKIPPKGIALITESRV